MKQTLILAACLLACQETKKPVKPLAASAAPLVSSAPSEPPPPPSPCVTSRPLSPGALLDNFEDGDGELVPRADARGSWFVASDDTAGATMQPANGPAIPQRLEQPRCGSSVFALHWSGRGFAGWGAVLGTVLRFDKRVLPVDWTAYRGIRFWVRSQEKQAGVLRVNLDDAKTQPEGGICYKPVSKDKDCWNSYGVDMPTLSDQWEERVILFSDLKQKYPTATAEPIDASRIYRLTFKTSPVNPFDVWIDDVGLVE